MVTSPLRASLLLASLLLLAATGCVGPLACGPAGHCGPIGMNTCDGCGECEGCGELYIDPWINHPADVCDPCDCCGNHNGQSCGKCRSVFGGVASLWGYRCDGATVECTRGGCCGDSCGGCDSCCAGDTCGGCDSCAGGGTYLSNAPLPPAGSPTPVEEVVDVKPAGPRYKPHRERRIFRARALPQPSVAEGPPQASSY